MDADASAPGAAPVGEAAAAAKPPAAAAAAALAPADDAADTSAAGEELVVSDGSDGEGSGEDSDDSHNNFCNKCGKVPEEGAIVLLCDRCPRAFHATCLGLTDETLPPEDAKWYCSICAKVVERQAAREAEKEKKKREREEARAAKAVEKKAAAAAQRKARAAAAAAGGPPPPPPPQASGNLLAALAPSYAAAARQPAPGGGAAPNVMWAAVAAAGGVPAMGPRPLPVAAQSSSSSGGAVASGPRLVSHVEMAELALASLRAKAAAATFDAVLKRAASGGAAPLVPADATALSLVQAGLMAHVSRMCTAPMPAATATGTSGGRRATCIRDHSTGITVAHVPVATLQLPAGGGPAAPGPEASLPLVIGPSLSTGTGDRGFSGTRVDTVAAALLVKDSLAARTLRTAIASAVAGAQPAAGGASSAGAASTSGAAPSSASASSVLPVVMLTFTAAHPLADAVAKATAGSADAAAPDGALASAIAAVAMEGSTLPITVGLHHDLVTLAGALYPPPAALAKAAVDAPGGQRSGAVNAAAAWSVGSLMQALAARAPPTAGKKPTPTTGGGILGLPTGMTSDASASASAAAPARHNAWSSVLLNGAPIPEVMSGTTTGTGSGTGSGSGDAPGIPVPPPVSSVPFLSSASHAAVAVITPALAAAINSAHAAALASSSSSSSSSAASSSASASASNAVSPAASPTGKAGASSDDDGDAVMIVSDAPSGTGKNTSDPPEGDAPSSTSGGGGGAGRKVQVSLFTALAKQTRSSSSPATSGSGALGAAAASGGDATGIISPGPVLSLPATLAAVALVAEKTPAKTTGATAIAAARRATQQRLLSKSPLVQALAYLPQVLPQSAAGAGANAASAAVKRVTHAQVQAALEACVGVSPLTAALATVQALAASGDASVAAALTPQAIAGMLAPLGMLQATAYPCEDTLLDTPHHDPLALRASLPSAPTPLAEHKVLGLSTGQYVDVLTVYDFFRTFGRDKYSEWKGRVSNTGSSAAGATDLPDADADDDDGWALLPRKPAPGGAGADAAAADADSISPVEAAAAAAKKAAAARMRLLARDQGAEPAMPGDHSTTTGMPLLRTEASDAGEPLAAAALEAAFDGHADARAAAAAAGVPAPAPAGAASGSAVVADAAADAASVVASGDKLQLADPLVALGADGSAASATSKRAAALLHWRGPRTSDPSLASLADFVAALAAGTGGSDAPGGARHPMLWRHWCFLARVHIALLRVLIEERDDICDRDFANDDDDDEDSSDDEEEGEGAGRGGGKAGGKGSGKGGKKGAAAKKAAAAADAKGAGDSDDDDGDEDAAASDERGRDAAAAKRWREARKKACEAFEDAMTQVEWDADIVLGQLNVLTWPELLRRAVLHGPLGAELRGHVSDDLLLAVARLSGTATVIDAGAAADAALSSQQARVVSSYFDLPLADRIALLKGLVDAVAGTESFAKVMSSLAREREQLIADKCKADADDDAALKEALVAVREAALAKEKTSFEKAGLPVEAAFATGAAMLQLAGANAPPAAVSAGDDIAALKERRQQAVAELAAAIDAHDAAGLRRAIARAKEAGFETGRGSGKTADAALTVAAAKLATIEAEDNMAKKTEDARRRMERREREMEKGLLECRVRPFCLGSDRFHRVYWVMGGDFSRIYVETPVADKRAAVIAAAVAEAATREVARANAPRGGAQPGAPAGPSGAAAAAAAGVTGAIGALPGAPPAPAAPSVPEYARRLQEEYEGVSAQAAALMEFYNPRYATGSNWGVLLTQEDYTALMAALDPRGSREGFLLASLRRWEAHFRLHLTPMSRATVLANLRRMLLPAVAGAASSSAAGGVAMIADAVPAGSAAEATSPDAPPAATTDVATGSSTSADGPASVAPSPTGDDADDDVVVVGSSGAGAKAGGRSKPPVSYFPSSSSSSSLLSVLKASREPKELISVEDAMLMRLADPGRCDEDDDDAFRRRYNDRHHAACMGPYYTMPAATAALVIARQQIVALGAELAAAAAENRNPWFAAASAAGGAASSSSSASAGGYQAWSDRVCGRSNADLTVAFLCQSVLELEAALYRHQKSKRKRAPTSTLTGAALATRLRDDAEQGMRGGSGKRGRPPSNASTIPVPSPPASSPPGSAGGGLRFRPEGWSDGEEEEAGAAVVVARRIAARVGATAAASSTLDGVIVDAKKRWYGAHQALATTSPAGGAAAGAPMSPVGGSAAMAVALARQAANTVLPMHLEYAATLADTASVGPGMHAVAPLILPRKGAGSAPAVVAAAAAGVAGTKGSALLAVTRDHDFYAWENDNDEDTSNDAVWTTRTQRRLWRLRLLRNRGVAAAAGSAGGSASSAAPTADGDVAILCMCVLELQDACSGIELCAPPATLRRTPRGGLRVPIETRDVMKAAIAPYRAAVKAASAAAAAASKAAKAAARGGRGAKVAPAAKATGGRAVAGRSSADETDTDSLLQVETDTEDDDAPVTTGKRGGGAAASSSLAGMRVSASGRVTKAVSYSESGAAAAAASGGRSSSRLATTSSGRATSSVSGNKRPRSSASPSDTEDDDATTADDDDVIATRSGRRRPASGRASGRSSGRQAKRRRTNLADTDDDESDDGSDHETDDDDANNDICGRCKKGGDLVCCDFCPLAFHPSCIGVSLKDLPDGEWHCPECNKEKCGVCGKGPIQAGQDIMCGDDKGGGCDLIFHLACVGLKKVPTGNWYCPSCEAAKKL